MAPGREAAAGPGTVETVAAWRSALRAEADALDPGAGGLAALTRLALLARDIDRAAADVVHACRGEALAWQAIASALGVSRQSAHERFSDRGQSSAAGRRWRRRSGEARPAVRPPSAAGR